MGKVNVDALKPGMVLAEDLFHSSGQLLLSKGLKLESNHLRVLKIWGIVSADIEGVSDGPAPPPLEEIDAAVRKTAEELTQKQFFHANVDHPFLRELFQICTLRRAQQMILPKSSGSGQGTPSLEAAPKAKVKSGPTASPRKQDLASLLSEDAWALASLPHIFSEINRVVNDPHSSATHVADVISKDPNLSTKLLKMVNSAFYGFPSKIDTISRTVTILGNTQLSSLALGTSVLMVFGDVPASLVDMKSFWEHSIACGVAARMIARFKKIANTERLFLAGLLHDIGRLIIYKHLPIQGREVLLCAQRTGCLLRSAELEMLGFDHTQIGGELIKKWNFPLILEDALTYHHQPTLSQHFLEASIVHIADILINALTIGTSGERFVPPLIPEAWTELGLQTDIFPRIVQLVDHQVAEITHLFFNSE
jgi:putative nucleotidyltransferase with HDIG domain